MKNLSQKWWYRLLKVIYVLLFLITVTLSFILTLDNAKPYTDLYNSKYSFVCDNGSVHGDFNYHQIDGSEWISVEFFDFPDEISKRIARFQCSYDEFLSTISQEEINEWGKLVINNKVEDLTLVKNYRLSFKDEKVIGTWSSFSFHLLLSILIPIVIFLLIRYVFFYIVAGEHRYLINEL